MVELRAVLEPEQLDGVFRALAHPARRDMLRRLSRAPASISDLAAPFSMSLAAASKHVHVLEAARLVRLTLDGRTRMCRLDPAPLAAAHEWIRFYEQFWTERLDSLDALFRTDSTSQDTEDEL